MTDREYLEEMIVLTTRLTDACNNFGLRSDEYNAVLKEIADSAVLFNRSRRRRPWFAFACCIVLLIVLLLIVYSVLSVLYTKGP